MTKQLIASLFLLSFGLFTFSKAFIVVDYFMNRSAFAKNCINKAWPKMHCNGKCQMMKKMQQEEKKDQQNPERKSESKNEVLSSRSFFFSLDISSIQSLNSYFIKLATTPVDRSFSIFHPPQV